MAKQQDVTFIREDGVKVTMCYPRVPKKQERTWTIEKSKHTAWTKGVKRYAHGVGGTLGTVG